MRKVGKAIWLMPIVAAPQTLGLKNLRNYDVEPFVCLERSNQDELAGQGGEIRQVSWRGDLVERRCGGGTSNLRPASAVQANLDNGVYRGEDHTAAVDFILALN